MGTERKTIRAPEVTVFFAATISITWLFWTTAWLGQKGFFSRSLPTALLLECGTFMPSLMGFVFAYRSGGKPEARRLLASLFDPYIKIRWLLFIFGMPAGVSALSCLIFSLLGGDLPKLQIPLPFISFAFVYVAIFQGPLGEEAGWRGFALKRMLQRLSPLKSAVLLGIVWAIWHLPLFFVEGTTQKALAGFGLPEALACYLLYTVMISILITLVYVMTGKNTLSALLFHTAANLSLGVVPLIFVEGGAIILLCVLGVVTSGVTYRFRKILFCEVCHEDSES